jgi:hypothetical protein
MAGHTLLTLAGVGVGAYLLYELFIKPASTAAAATPAPTTPTTPGTTTSMQQQQQPTSISTAPSTTPTRASDVLIQSMQGQLAGQTVANADQWNWAYTRITGRPIDQSYAFNFDAVYGTVATRSSAGMTALMFLSKAAAAALGLSVPLSGLRRYGLQPPPWFLR